MIEFKNVSKNYGEKQVLKDFSFSAEENKITAILGESGSGKSTLLAVATDTTVYSGEVAGDYKPFSVVFQKNCLVGNLTAEENVLLVSPEADAKAVLKEVWLDGYEKRRPKELSAGQARRVAIARALSYPAKTLFLDEPFINLDVATKYSLMQKIKNAQKTSPKTVLFITHDISEAAFFADRIAVLSGGKIVKDVKNINEKTEKELFGFMMTLKPDGE